MKKVAIVYWSGTGNTEAMAMAVQKGAEQAGASEATLYQASKFSADLADGYDAIAFGCPSMGAEELEDSEFRPMFDDVAPHLSGKDVALFGSYGWGDGEWMRNWAEECEGLGCAPVTDPVICNGAPEDETEQDLLDMGELLAK